MSSLKSIAIERKRAPSMRGDVGAAQQDRRGGCAWTGHAAAASVADVAARSVVKTRKLLGAHA